jgi:uncharacterized protein (DUF924 family)
MSEIGSLKQENIQVLNFWFRELTPRQWFGGGTELDVMVRQRFTDLLQKAKQNECDDWAETARGRLALIILLDQFSRHIYRNTPDAFAQDAKAQQLCLDGIESGQDKQLTSAERHFFYMPLMHAESVELQKLSVEKFTALRNEAEAILGFAKGHQSMVERFGRFPHRNETLGRASTEAERSFLISDENIFK